MVATDEGPPTPGPEQHDVIDDVGEHGGDGNAHVVLRVEEADEIASIVARVVNSQGDAATDLYTRWRAILCKYQEECQLLDPLLESIVSPLAGTLQAQALRLRSTGTDPKPGAGQHERRRILAVCRLLNVLVSVRGHKTVVRFFPNDVSELEAVVDVLQAIRDARPESDDPDTALASWEAQGMLLLWLSMLILIPFALATVDTAQAIADSAQQPDARSKPYTLLVARILDMCKQYLSHPGCVREMSALVLGRLLTRPDMGPALQEALQWSAQQLAAAGTGAVDAITAPFLFPGVLQTLAHVFKLGKRTALLPYAATAWAQLRDLHAAQAGEAAGAGTSSRPGLAAGASGVLSRKLAIKLTQRVALTFLAPRLAPWRYQRPDGGRDVELRLGSAAGTTALHGSGLDGQEAGETRGGDDEDEGFELVEEVEEVIEVLLSALRDKDTVVRWSAAKGVGRMTGCLPRELGDEVVASMLGLFKPTESDAAWHGGCLALAELGRRGLLLPERLASLTPIIRAALVYDVRRGPHSTGAHVRDAAAYVCWAFARAYEPDVLAAVAPALSAALLQVACYDREVNCRRAAAAAFQEAVGRLGTIPHGLDLLPVADYFCVGNINNAYLSVATAVARYEPYRQPLADHLLAAKLRHWDKAVRLLAARALAALVPMLGDPFLATTGLDTLLPLCTDSVLEVRHGAVVGVAELLPALRAAGIPVDPSSLAQVAGLVPAIDRARLYRGKGGEVMREAVSALVQSMARVALPMAPPQHAKVLEAIDENLRHPHAAIQKAAVRALHTYSRAYLGTPADLERFARYFDGYVARLHDANVAVRRGYALALGALPQHVLAPKAAEVLAALVSGTAIEEAAEERDTDARAHCVASLADVAETVFAPPNPALPLADAAHHLRDTVLPCLHACLADYTTDNRGDVGSWVREAAMGALTRSLALAALLQAEGGPGEGAADMAALLSGAVPAAAAALLKQGVERIARMREAAMLRLRQLVSQPLVHAALPAAAALEAALPTDQEELTGVVSLEAVRKLVPLMLAADVFRRPILEGTIFGIGGVDAALAKASSDALLAVLETAGAALGALAEDFVAIWHAHARSARMAAPLMRAAGLLITRCPEAGACPVPAAPPEGGRQPLSLAFATLARAETRQCTDVPHLLEAATLLSALIAQPQPCRHSAYQGLSVLLANRYPKVRRHTAEQLYVALLFLEPSEVGGRDGGVEPAAAEAATELLLATEWDAGLEAAKAARDALAALLGVQVPAMKAAAPGGPAKPARDEYASYQSLLDDFARGV